MRTVPVSELKSTLPLEEQFKLTSIGPYGKKYSRDNKSIIVFVDMPSRPGPFGNGKGTIQDEFMWRRSHAAPLPPKQLLEIIKHGSVKVEGLELTGKAFYSHYAGCSCPCSPGYVVRTDSYCGERLALHLTHVDVIKSREEQKAKLAAAEAEEQFIAIAMGVPL